jgi:hypothetical protein
MHSFTSKDDSNKIIIRNQISQTEALNKKADIPSVVTLTAIVEVGIALVPQGALAQVPGSIAHILTITVCADTHVVSWLEARSVPDRPVHDDRCTILCPLVDETKLANEVTAPEAVPPNLRDHGIEAWVESPHAATIHRK